MRRFSLILAALTTGIASCAFLGAVSVSAMWGYVFVASLIGTASALVLGQPGQWPALLAAALPATIWAVVVNAVSGEMSGPAARSSAICGLATVVALHGARGGRTDQFLAGVVWLVSGAMLYGSAGEVLPIVVATAVCGVVTTFAITYARHRLTTSKWGAGALLFILASLTILVFSVLVLAKVLPSLVNDREPVISTALRQQTIDFSPSWEPAKQQTQPNTTPISAPDKDVFVPQGTENLNQTVLIVVLTLLLIIVLAGFARMLWVHHKLARWKQQLRALPPRQAIAGSWAWATVNLRRWRWPIPPSIGVENAVAWAERQQWPAVLHDDFKNASLLATNALFARNEPDPHMLEESWTLSTGLVSNGRRSTPRWKRFLALFESVNP